MCGWDFRFLGSGQHIFQRIGTIFHTELKLSNADFMVSGKLDRKFNSDFGDVQILVSVSISAMWNDDARNSLRIFTKFCPLLGCSSTHVVFVRNQNWISDSRGVHIHILAVFRLWSRRFSTVGAQF